VQITSLNLKDEIVPFIDVTIEGNGITRKLWPRGSGDEYANGGLVELPVGVYRVTTRNGNYYGFRRAPFRVRAGTVTNINISPLLRVRAQMLMGDGSDRYQLAPKPSYDVYTLPHGSDKAVSMVVRYDQKRKIAGSINYEGGALADGKVMVSYDALAIYATTVRLDAKTFTLIASGDVTLEDGAKRVKANNVTVRFNNGAPEVTTN
jgi:hypothetical protein